MVPPAAAAGHRSWKAGPSRGPRSDRLGCPHAHGPGSFGVGLLYAGAGATASERSDRAAVVDAPVIVAALRTSIGTAGRSLAELAELPAPVLTALADTVTGSPSGSAPTVVRDVVLGNCMGPGGNVARVAELQAGLPADVPALTVDRPCASGLAAIALAATDLCGEAGIVLAGGVESASTAPWRFWPPAGGGDPIRYERAPFAPAALGDADMGPAADALADEYAVTRAVQDAYAAGSYARAMATLVASGFEEEIVPIAGVSRDDRPRAGLAMAGCPGCGRRSPWHRS